jgi:hypothetical protein
MSILSIFYRINKMKKDVANYTNVQYNLTILHKRNKTLNHGHIEG